MKWRIAVPIVVLLAMVGYVVYQGILQPGYDPGHTLRGALVRFAKAFHEERDAEKVEPFCSQRAVGQCARLLAEIQARERREPGFRFERFTVKAEASAQGTQAAAIHLYDTQGKVFLVVNCTVTQLPDQSWRITEVTWHPLVEM